MRNSSTSTGEKPPIRPTGVLFALAANLLFVTVTASLLDEFQLNAIGWLLVRMGAPLLAGILTARYAGVRGGIHAFLGSLISIPVFAIFVFIDNWQLAFFACAFCTLGGALTELFMRRTG